MGKKNINEIARKRVKEKKSFYSHLNAFCIITSTLFVVNYLTTPGTWWFLLPIVGWAIAVIGHYLNVFGFPSFRDEVWEEEQFDVELEKLERQENLGKKQEDILDLANDKLKLKALEKNINKYGTDDFV